MPARGIWSAQHLCVTSNFSPDDEIPSNPAQAIIDHQLNVRHYSVLDHAFVKIDFGGFPHDTVAQMCRHQGKNTPLVQSLRYTGKQFGEITALYDGAGGSVGRKKMYEAVEKLFYTQPVGTYSTRDGFYEVTESGRRSILHQYAMSACAYNDRIERGIPEESARRLLSAGYRQNFCLSGTVRSICHMLDQRTLADSQIECQTAAYLALEELKLWEPTLFGWYEKTKAGRNNLAL